MKFRYFCSSPLAVCLGTGTWLSTRAASSRTWYESVTRLWPPPSTPCPGSADDPKGVAGDARVIADVLHARGKNSRRLGEVSVSTVPQLALLFRGFTGAPSPNATPRRRRIA